MEVVLCGQSSGDSLCLWDLRRGMIIRQFKQSPPFQKNCVSSLGEHFLIGSSNLKFNPVTGKSKMTEYSNLIAWTFENESSHCHNTIPFSLSCFEGSPCGKYIFGGTNQGKLLVWHATSGALTHIIDMYQEITVLRVDPQAKVLAIGFSDGLIHIFSIPLLLSSNIMEAKLCVLSLHVLPITCLSFSFTSNRIFSTSEDQTLKIWDMNTHICLCSVSFPTSLNCIAFGAIEDSIFVGGADGNIYKVNMWELPSSDFGILDIHKEKSSDLLVCKGHKGAVNSVDVNIDGSIIISASDDGSTKVWSTSNCQNISTFVKAGGPVTFVKIFLKPIPCMIGSLSNTKNKENYPLLSPFSNILTETTVINAKLPGSNSKNKTSTPQSIPLSTNQANYFPLCSDLHGASMDVEKYFSVSQSQFQNYLDEVDHLAEIKILKDNNSYLQLLNKDMLKSIINDTTTG